MKPLYNELVGTAEIVHNTEVFLLQRLNSTVNAVLGPATVPLINYRGFLYMDVLNRATVYSTMYNQQLIIISIYFDFEDCCVDGNKLLYSNVIDLGVASSNVFRSTTPLKLEGGDSSEHLLLVKHKH